MMKIKELKVMLLDLKIKVSNTNVIQKYNKYITFS